jgi:mono/diheme cytochrome c family protein
LCRLALLDAVEEICVTMRFKTILAVTLIVAGGAAIRVSAEQAAAHGLSPSAGQGQGPAQAQAQTQAQGQGRGRGANPASQAKPVTTLTSPVTGNSARGKQLYYDYACYSCHGFNGETGARTFVPNWPANLATEGSFIAYLRGRANVAPVQPSTSMPNYPVESLSDAQARDIYAHIRTFKSAPPTVDKIGTMQQILEAAKKPYKR